MWHNMYTTECRKCVVLCCAVLCCAVLCCAVPYLENEHVSIQVNHPVVLHHAVGVQLDQLGGPAAASLVVDVLAQPFALDGRHVYWGGSLNDSV